MNGYDRRNGMWFGTQERSEWIPAPLRGADTSPQGWSANGTFLNGGAYARNSFGSHKQYTFEWSEATSPAAAQLIQSYASGSFGRGPLYFVDPLTYKQNILPARWADPSITLDWEGAPLRGGMGVSSTPTSGGDQVGLPVRSVTYSRTAADRGDGTPYPGASQSVFLPIPAGMTLNVAAWYQSSGPMSLRLMGMDHNGYPLGGTTGVDVPANENSVQLPTRTSLISGAGRSGARLFIRDGATWGNETERSITISGIRAWLTPTGLNPDVIRGWMGGMGHSGATLLGKPTLQSNSIIEGGRMSVAATFAEVGDWLYA